MTDDQQTQPAVVIKTVDNGPYQIKGPIQVVDHDNNKYDIGAGRTRLLCRCGHSARKPFCDGSHVKIGFHSSERSTTEDRQ